MTRKDFILIAATIKGTRWLDQDDRDTLAVRFANALATTNEHFDRERFVRACGVRSDTLPCPEGCAGGNTPESCDTCHGSGVITVEGV